MPPPSSDARDQVRARLDLVEVVQGHVRLVRKGREWVGLCPFHQEKTPSFNVNQQKQTWICRGCGKGGDIFDFVEEVEKTDFRGALEILAERAGVELERDPEAHRRSQLRKRLLDLNRIAARYYEYVLHSSPAGEAGRRLLAERGVDEEMARRFQLGFAPGTGHAFAAYVRDRGLSVQDAVEAGLLMQRGRGDFFVNRLVVPIRDERGSPLAFTGRAVDPADLPKYRNTPESPVYVKGRVLFGLDLAREEIGRRGHAVMVEGQFDVIAAHRHGVGNVVASSGTALTDDQVRLLSRFTDELHLVFDDDPAGHKATVAAIERCLERGLRVKVVDLGGDKDPDEFFRATGEGGEAAWEAAVARAQTEWEYLIRQAMAGLDLTRADELGLAAERIRGVLAKITDPAVKVEYLNRAAGWSGIDLHVLGARQVGPGLNRQVERLIAEPKGNDVGTGRAPTLNTISRGPHLSSGRYLLQILVVRPEAVRLVRDRLQLEHMVDEDRDTYLRLLETIDSGDAQALQRELPSFPASAQALIRDAWSNPPPGADDDSALDDLLVQIEREWMRRQLAALTSHLAEAERIGDRERALTLEREHGAMARAMEALNQVGAGALSHSWRARQASPIQHSTQRES